MTSYKNSTVVYIQGVPKVTEPQTLIKNINQKQQI